MHEENISNEDILFNINDQLFLETLLMMIRGHTIKYSFIKKKKSLEEERKLQQGINDSEDEINNILHISEETCQNLSLKKTRLTEIRKNKIEGVMLRSRTRYQDLGEKPTKYFLGLENRQYTNKVMSKITDANGTEYTETKDILKCQGQFYKSLYDKVHISENRSINDCLGENCQKLSDDSAQTLEGKITYAELLQALKNMKNEKVLVWMGLAQNFSNFFLH